MSKFRDLISRKPRKNRLVDIFHDKLLTKDVPRPKRRYIKKRLTKTAIHFVRWSVSEIKLVTVTD